MHGIIDISRLKHLRPTYAGINLSRLAGNISIARKMSGSDIIAIVKADGYGHGAGETAEYAYKRCGVRNFGVATVSEGFSLRHRIVAPDVRIIVLGFVDEIFYPEVIEHKLHLTLYNADAASGLHAYLEEHKATAPVVIKIDTGMGRLGFGPDLDLSKFKEKYPRFIISHIMSHLSSSDSDKEYSARQEGIFSAFIQRTNSGDFDTSLFNSSAVANFNNKYTFTRPGLFLYGYVNGESPYGLKPVMSIYSKVVHVQKVSKGASISYDRRFVAKKDTWVGVVPVGYADGYRRGLTNKGIMYVDGIKCPVLGTVCMDMTMIDVSPFGEGAYGRTVEILGDYVSAADIAKSVDTIEYEILCGISARIPRIYESGEAE